jgi:hypothetical protein
MNCVYVRCEEREQIGPIPFSQYLNHLEKIHFCEVVDCTRGGEITYQQTWYEQDLAADQDDSWPPCLFKFHGFTFMGMSQIQKSTLGSWVTIIGSKKDANQFRAQISIESAVDSKDEDVSKSYMRWEGPVIPIHLSGSAVMKEAKCMLTSIHFIHAICTKPSTTSEESSETTRKDSDFRREENEETMDSFWTVNCKLIKKM